jgi:hypothetical protein
LEILVQQQAKGWVALMKCSSLAVALLALLCGGLGQAKAGIVIDTTPNWSGQGITPFGEPNAAFGQTFNAPASILSSFVLLVEYAGVSSPPPPLNFKAYVMAWGGSKATGPVLYESNLQTLQPDTGAFLTFETGGIALTVGSEYVAFLDVPDQYYFVLAQAILGYVPAYIPSYAGGTAVFFGGGPGFGLLSTEDWINPGGDLAFRADFTNVPEPASLTMLSMGILGLSAYTWRRRKKAATAASSTLPP